MDVVVEIISKDINPDARGDQWLVKANDQYYVVSAANAPFTGPEVLVFYADEDGEVTNWLEVTGTRGTLSHKKGIELLREYITEADGVPGRG